MVSMSLRMHKLQTRLLAIRLGSGALILPKDVKRIHLRFHERIRGGHMGPRKFWRHELVRLKYHNPAVPMTIDRSVRDTDPATMSIHFAGPNARQTSTSPTSSPAPTDSTTPSTPPSDHDPTERVETIEMKGRTSAEILEDFTRVTNAYSVEATADDREQLRMLEEQRLRSARDSKLSKEVRDRKKREEDLLKQVIGDVQAN